MNDQAQKIKHQERQINDLIGIVGTHHEVLKGHTKILSNGSTGDILDIQQILKNITQQHDNQIKQLEKQTDELAVQAFLQD